MTEKTPEELLAEQARIEEEARAKHEADVASVPRDTEISAAARLRAFEDEVFGKNAVRIGDQIERGSGSMFKNPEIMSPARHRQYAALERLVEVEQRLTVAAADLAAAQAQHDAAVAAVDAAKTTEGEV